MKQNLISMLAGFVFAIGVGVSGMTLPQNVLGFLDVTGSWNPTLMFVMVGAIAAHSLAYVVTKKNPVSKTKITFPLIFGASLFGIGWGLAGYCPGPALASLLTFNRQTWVFFLSLVTGMALFKLIDSKFIINR